MQATAMRALLRGRVQGVGYRAFAHDEAERLGVRGFARNLFDGRVEVVAVAAPEVLDRYAARLRVGPPGARVEGIERTPLEPAPEFTGFEVRATGHAPQGGSRGPAAEGRT